MSSSVNLMIVEMLHNFRWFAVESKEVGNQIALTEEAFKVLSDSL